MSEETRKALDQFLDEAEQKLSRGKGHDIDSLYPILRMIVKEGLKNWITQYQNERTRESEMSEGAYLQLEELLKELENNPVEEGKIE